MSVLQHWSFFCFHALICRVFVRSGVCQFKRVAHELCAFEKRVVFLVDMKKKNIVFLLRFRVKQSNKKKRKICSEKERCKATVVKKKKKVMCFR